jgi:hypothetical protein
MGDHMEAGSRPKFVFTVGEFVGGAVGISGIPRWPRTMLREGRSLLGITHPHAFLPCPPLIRPFADHFICLKYDYASICFTPNKQ